MESIATDDRRLTAATWVAGTGAFLLLVAATVFAAVRWGELPTLAKLVILCGATAAVLLGGGVLRRTLPATGGAIEHLGALLVPLDAGAIAAHAGERWPGILLAAGAAGTTTFVVVGRTLDSVVLRWATFATVVLGVAGVAGMSVVPAGLALALLAAAALAAGHRRAATTWAGIAGLSPLLVAVPAPWLGGGVVRDLGLAGRNAAALAVFTGAVVAFVFGREARRLDEPSYAFASAVALLLGAGTTWSATMADHSFLTFAGAFLVLELSALFLRHDHLWRPVTAFLAMTAEVLTAIATGLVALAGVVVLLVWPQFNGQLMVGAGVLAAGWFAADLRRQRGRLGVGFGTLLGGSWAPSAPLLALALLSAAAATGAPMAVGFTLLAITAAAVATARPWSHGTGTLAAAFVPVAMLDSGTLGAAAGAVAALLVAEMSVLRARAGVAGAWLPLVAALPVLGSSAWVATTNVTPAVTMFLLGAWVVSLVVDRESVAVGDAIRLAALAAIVLPVDVAVVGGVIVGLIGVECLRRRDPRILNVAVGALPVWLASLLDKAGMDIGAIGVGLTIAGVVLAGMSAVLDEGPWRAPLVRIVIALEVLGVAVAADSASTFGTALLVAGAVLVGGGISLRRRELMHAGAVTMQAGTWIHLGAEGIDVIELYAAPLALYLLVLGFFARRRGASSWQAYAAPLVLAGGLPLLVRILGGGGGHALAAGTVAVVALVVGGQRRLGAPLVLGTVGCVGLAVYEALAVRPTVPTWGWLGLAGSILLGAGVTIERTGLTPVASGRRLADVVMSEFD